MSLVDVEINSKMYKISCEDGEEAIYKKIAVELNNKINMIKEEISNIEREISLRKEQL